MGSETQCYQRFPANPGELWSGCPVRFAAPHHGAKLHGSVAFAPPPQWHLKLSALSRT